MTPQPRHSAAGRFAAVDAADPLPSWEDLAASVGVLLDPSKPGDTGWTSEVEVMLYWPNERAA